VLTLAITSSSIPLSQVEDLVDTRLAPKISQLNGVGLVTISGGQKPAVRIQANPTAMSSYGINMEDLRTALTQASVNAAKGNFDGPRQDYQIDANDQLVTSDDYRKVVVAYRNGAPVMLTDVANVVNGVENNNQAAWMNQTPAVILNVQRQPGANTISVVKGIKTLLPQLEANLPTGIQVTTLTDLTTSIEASVSDVEFELLLTVGLVVMVIFLFLRSLYATIIPSVAVPLSLVGTFAAMYILGYIIADGADHLHRFRCGRCHRDDRKHLAVHRSGRSSHGSSAKGSGANWLHHSLADCVPHRRSDSAAIHGRRRGAPIP
jgi:multidrug efflux pump